MNSQERTDRKKGIYAIRADKGQIQTDSQCQKDRDKTREACWRQRKKIERLMHRGRVKSRNDLKKKKEEKK